MPAVAVARACAADGRGNTRTADERGSGRFDASAAAETATAARRSGLSLGRTGCLAGSGDEESLTRARLLGGRLLAGELPGSFGQARVPTFVEVDDGGGSAKDKPGSNEEESLTRARLLSGRLSVGECGGDGGGEEAEAVSSTDSPLVAGPSVAELVRAARARRGARSRSCGSNSGMASEDASEDAVGSQIALRLAILTRSRLSASSLEAESNERSLSRFSSVGSRLGAGVGSRSAVDSTRRSGGASLEPRSMIGVAHASAASVETLAGGNSHDGSRPALARGRRGGSGMRSCTVSVSSRLSRSADERCVAFNSGRAPRHARERAPPPRGRRSPMRSCGISFESSSAGAAANAAGGQASASNGLPTDAATAALGAPATALRVGRMGRAMRSWMSSPAGATAGDASEAWRLPLSATAVLRRASSCAGISAVQLGVLMTRSLAPAVAPAPLRIGGMRSSGTKPDAAGRLAAATKIRSAANNTGLKRENVLAATPLATPAETPSSSSGGGAGGEGSGASMPTSRDSPCASGASQKSAPSCTPSVVTLSALHDPSGASSAHTTV
eukprot:scaffold259898_cov27-Tisochrysis_lutea.AAC.1